MYRYIPFIGSPEELREGAEYVRGSSVGARLIGFVSMNVTDDGSFVGLYEGAKNEGAKSAGKGPAEARGESEFVAFRSLYEEQGPVPSRSKFLQHSFSVRYPL